MLAATECFAHGPDGRTIGLRAWVRRYGKERRRASIQGMGARFNVGGHNQGR